MFIITTNLKNTPHITKLTSIVEAVRMFKSIYARLTPQASVQLNYVNTDKVYKLAEGTYTEITPYTKKINDLLNTL